MNNENKFGLRPAKELAAETDSMTDRVIMKYDLSTHKAFSKQKKISAIKVLVRAHNVKDKQSKSDMDPGVIAEYLEHYEETLDKIDDKIKAEKSSFLHKHGPMLAAFLIGKSFMSEDNWNECVRRTHDFSNLDKTDPMYCFNEFVDRKLPKGYSNEARWEVFLKTLSALRAKNKNMPLEQLRVPAEDKIFDPATWQ